MNDQLQEATVKTDRKHEFRQAFAKCLYAESSFTISNTTWQIFIQREESDTTENCHQKIIYFIKHIPDFIQNTMSWHIQLGQKVQNILGVWKIKSLSNHCKVFINVDQRRRNDNTISKLYFVFVCNYFFIFFEIMIQLYYFPLPFSPSIPSHISFLYLFQIYCLFH